MIDTESTKRSGDTEMKFGGCSERECARDGSLVSTEVHNDSYKHLAGLKAVLKELIVRTTHTQAAFYLA